jgi:hypothetical protein
MRAYDTTSGLCRLLLFRGTREDALEYLPSLCPGEQLELGRNRISLVTGQERIDLFIRAELSGSAPDTSSIMLVEICFSHKETDRIDSFVQCLQRRQCIVH